MASVCVDGATPLPPGIKGEKRGDLAVFVSVLDYELDTVPSLSFTLRWWGEKTSSTITVPCHNGDESDGGDAGDGGAGSGEAQFLRYDVVCSAASLRRYLCDMGDLSLLVATNDGTRKEVGYVQVSLANSVTVGSGSEAVDDDGVLFSQSVDIHTNTGNIVGLVNITIEYTAASQADDDVLVAATDVAAAAVAFDGGDSDSSSDLSGVVKGTKHGYAAVGAVVDAVDAAALMQDDGQFSFSSSDGGLADTTIDSLMLEDESTFISGSAPPTPIPTHAYGAISNDSNGGGGVHRGKVRVPPRSVVSTHSSAIHDASDDDAEPRSVRPSMTPQRPRGRSRSGGGRNGARKKKNNSGGRKTKTSGSARDGGAVVLSVLLGKVSGVPAGVKSIEAVCRHSQPRGHGGDDGRVQQRVKFFEGSIDDDNRTFLLDLCVRIEIPASQLYAYMEASHVCVELWQVSATSGRRLFGVITLPLRAFAHSVAEPKSVRALQATFLPKVLYAGYRQCSGLTDSSHNWSVFMHVSVGSERQTERLGSATAEEEIFAVRTSSRGNDKIYTAPAAAPAASSTSGTRVRTRSRAKSLLTPQNTRARAMSAVSQSQHLVSLRVTLSHLKVLIDAIDSVTAFSFLGCTSEAFAQASTASVTSPGSTPNTSGDAMLNASLLYGRERDVSLDAVFDVVVGLEQLETASLVFSCECVGVSGAVKGLMAVPVAALLRGFAVLSGWYKVYASIGDETLACVKLSVVPQSPVPQHATGSPIHSGSSGHVFPQQTTTTTTTAPVSAPTATYPAPSPADRDTRRLELRSLLDDLTLLQNRLDSSLTGQAMESPPAAATRSVAAPTTAKSVGQQQEVVNLMNMLGGGD